MPAATHPLARPYKGYHFCSTFARQELCLCPCADSGSRDRGKRWTGLRGMGRWGLLLLTVLLACETPATADRERAKAGAYRGCQVAGALCGDGAAAGSLVAAPSACLPRAARWRLELRGGKQGGAVGKSTTGCSPVCTPCPTDSGLLCGTDETRRFVGGDGSEVCACGFPCFSCPRAPVPSDAPTVHRAL